jgi:hypothetical protein
MIWQLGADLASGLMTGMVFGWLAGIIYFVLLILRAWWRSRNVEGD